MKIILFLFGIVVVLIGCGPKNESFTTSTMISGSSTTITSMLPTTISTTTLSTSTSTSINCTCMTTTSISTTSTIITTTTLSVTTNPPTTIITTTTGTTTTDTNTTVTTCNSSTYCGAASHAVHFKYMWDCGPSTGHTCEPPATVSIGGPYPDCVGPCNDNADPVLLDGDNSNYYMKRQSDDSCGWYVACVPDSENWGHIRFGRYGWNYLSTWLNLGSQREIWIIYNGPGASGGRNATDNFQIYDYNPSPCPSACEVVVTTLYATTTSINPLNPNILYYNNFNDDTLGTYSVANLNADWNNPSWDDGVMEGRLNIISGAEAFQGNSLRQQYIGNQYGPGYGGQWQLDLGGSYNELFCSYWIKFDADFDFVKGGKIPGLCGGTCNTGGSMPNGMDGWSARMMWRTGGYAVQYLYHPDQPTVNGEDMNWDIPFQRYFIPGQWHHVEHRIKMNTPTVYDGILQSWFDGELALDLNNIRYRDASSFSIDTFYYSTFFGGGDMSWSPPADMFAYFDEFVISTMPVGH